MEMPKRHQTTVAGSQAARKLSPRADAAYPPHGRKHQEPSLRVCREQKAVAVEFAPQAGVTGTLTLTQDTLLALIRNLGCAHQQLTQDVPPPQLWGKQIDCVFNAPWHIQPEPLSEGSLISFFHPAFGPVGFVIPRDQVAAIVRTLSLHLELPPPPRERRN
jgi:hypothetical protein